MQLEADPGDDERELTDLGHAHAGLHRSVASAAGKEGSNRDTDELARNDENREPDRKRPMIGQGMNVELHAHGNEENGPEHVADRANFTLHLLART